MIMETGLANNKILNTKLVTVHPLPMSP